MKSVFKPIKPQKIPEEIAHQIKALIKGGKLQPGEKLPTERSLAEYFNVGRSSLREALRFLETLGFLEVKGRKGVYVRNVTSPSLFDPLRQILEEDKDKLLELLDLRKDVENASAYKAAMVRTEADLSQIESFLENMAIGVDSADFAINAEIGFHIAIAQATHNMIRTHFLESVLNSFWDHWDVLAHKIQETENNVSLVYRQHKMIYEAIKKGDPDLSRELMNEHLVWTEERWKEFG